MQRISFCDNWEFYPIDAPDERQKIAVPHDAMLGEKRSAASMGKTNTGWFMGRDYCYTKAIYAPEEWREKRITLDFEGVYHNCEVWLNDRKIGFRPYGYSDFLVELSEHLRYGEENELLVIARNADQPNSRWYSGAGIYRPVWLLAGEKKHILPDGIRVRTCSIAPPAVEITVQTQGTGHVSIQWLDGDQVLGSADADSDGRATVRAVLEQGQLWSPDHPKCYRCVAHFGEDTAETTFGIRTIGWSREQGLTLNGERLIIRGACIHHDNGVLGACCFPEAEERKVRIMKENGYNALRSAHNPCSRALLDACDRQGMLMMDELVDCWYIHKTQNDYVDYFEDWWQKDLEDMVRKDYSHPSVILYSTGNEVSETAQPKGIALTGEMTQFLHSLDDTRPVTCGINIFFNLLSSMGFGVYSDDKAKKDAAQEDQAVGSQFFNNLAGLFGRNTMKIGAMLHGCDVKTRDAFANMDIAGYNYGINRYKGDLKKYPDRLILGSETFCSDAYAFWELAKREPRLVGDFVWAGMDYLGEVGVGAWEYDDYAPAFDHGPGWLTAGSGRVDLIGTPLGEALYTRVAFEQEEGPLIAVRPPVYEGKKHSPSAWKMSNSIPSWNWHGCEGKKAVVEVFSRSPMVELWLNGKKIGRKQNRKDCLVSFTVPYAPGELTAAALDENGRILRRYRLKTGSEDTELRLLPEEKTVAPNGLAFVPIAYTDTNGGVKPLERHRVRIRVVGGRLLGLGHACPYNPDGFLNDDTDTYFGRALAVVRAGKNGTVRILAEDGTRECEAVIPIE